MLVKVLIVVRVGLGWLWLGLVVVRVGLSWLWLGLVWVNWVGCG